MYIKRYCKKMSSPNQDLLYLSAWPIQKRDSISVHDDKSVKSLRTIIHTYVSAVMSCQLYN